MKSVACKKPVAKMARFSAQLLFMYHVVLNVESEDMFYDEQHWPDGVELCAGRLVYTDARCEDDHLVAIPLLHDITVMTYSTVNKQWYVFNESGTTGNICLFSLPGHFDVLAGVGSPQVLPTGAHTHLSFIFDFNSDDCDSATCL